VASPIVEDHLLVECAGWNGRERGTIVASGPFDRAAHFGAQLEALRAIGLLDDEEVESWRARFARGFPDDAPLAVDAELRARVERYLEPLHGDDLARAMEVLESLEVLSEEEIDHWFERIAPEDDGDDIPRTVMRDLRAVLLGPGDEVDGFRLVSVELYDDAVAVRWTSDSGPELERGLELADDVGTEYEPAGGGASGGGPDRRTCGVSEFVPAVPEGARLLIVTREGHRFELELVR
jgi:hypothetical protein